MASSFPRLAALLVALTLIAAACGAPDQSTAWDVDTGTGDAAERQSDEPDSTTTTAAAVDPVVLACAAVAEHATLALADAPVDALLESATSVVDAVDQAGLPPFGIEEYVAASWGALEDGESVDDLDNEAYRELTAVIGLSPWGGHDGADPFEGLADCENFADLAADEAWSTVVRDCADALIAVVFTAGPERLASDPDDLGPLVEAYRHHDYPLSCVALADLGPLVLGEERAEALLGSLLDDVVPPSGPEMDPAAREVMCAAYEEVLVTAALTEPLTYQVEAVRAWLETFGPEADAASLIAELDTATAALEEVGWRQQELDFLAFRSLVAAFLGVPSVASPGTVYPRDLALTCALPAVSDEMAMSAVRLCILGMEGVLKARLDGGDTAVVLEALRVASAPILCDDLVLWLAPQLDARDVADVYLELPEDVAAQLGFFTID